MTACLRSNRVLWSQTQGFSSSVHAKTQWLASMSYFKWQFYKHCGCVGRVDNFMVLFPNTYYLSTPQSCNIYLHQTESYEDILSVANLVYYPLKSITLIYTFFFKFCPSICIFTTRLNQESCQSGFASLRILHVVVNDYRKFKMWERIRTLETERPVCMLTYLK